MSPRKTRIEWQAEQRRLECAGEQADAIVDRLGLACPIDPLEVARSEHPLLRVGGRDFKDSFDGKLKFNREKGVFLLFFNTKYDAGLPSGRHHPRTRFSIAHELGHYFIEHHYRYLRHRGRPHPSSSEFRSKVLMEREADSFAASLLLPTPLLKPLVNRGELSLDVLDKLAGEFNTSLVSTTIRSVRLSDFPCAVAGIREGQIAWMFSSDPLVEAGCFRRKKTLESTHAQRRWRAFSEGNTDRSRADGMARYWFQLDNREEELHEVYVTEEYLPVRIMDTLLVLLTLDEEDLFGTGEEDEFDEDGD